MDCLAKSDRVDLKKLSDQKSALTILKAQMFVKAEQQVQYKPFHVELVAILQEQEKFQEALEMKVALAEAIDPVQESFSFEIKILGALQISAKSRFQLMKLAFPIIGASWAPRSFCSSLHMVHACTCLAHP